MTGGSSTPANDGAGAGRPPPAPKSRPTGRPPPGAWRVPPGESPVAPPRPRRLEPLAAWRVKAVYTQERSRWETLKAGEPVRYRPPAAYDGRPAVTVEGELELERLRSSVWQRVVDWCAARRVPAEAYVRYCFRCVPLRWSKAPEPAQLLTDRWLARWQEGKHRRREEARLELEIQKRTARTQLLVRQKVHGQTPERATLWVCVNGGALGLSPLFCYCLALAVGGAELRRVARELRPRAVLQFEAARPAYRKAWASVLPAGFARESRRLYPHLLAALWASRGEEGGYDAAFG